MHDDPLKRSVCLGLAPVLLVLTALLQVYRVEQQDLHPWKGGGFGMFAALPTQRALRIIPIAEDRMGYVTPVPSRHRKAVDRILFLPREARLREFARTLLAEEWSLVGRERGPSQIHPVPIYDTLGKPDPEPVRIVEIRLELHAFRYDSESGEVRAELIKKIAEKAGGSP